MWSDTRSIRTLKLGIYWQYFLVH